MAVSVKGAHFPPEVILMGIRWYLAYPLSSPPCLSDPPSRGVCPRASLRLEPHRSGIACPGGAFPRHV